MFPMPQNHNLVLSKSPLIQDVEQYRKLVDRLIYIAITRPDLAYYVYTLDQFMQVPRQVHWEAAVRVVRYLKKNPGQSIFLKSNYDLKLYGWCNSDYASCPNTGVPSLDISSNLVTPLLRGRQRSNRR